MVFIEDKMTVKICEIRGSCISSPKSHYHIITNKSFRANLNLPEHMKTLTFRKINEFSHMRM